MKFVTKIAAVGAGTLLSIGALTYGGIYVQHKILDKDAAILEERYTALRNAVDESTLVDYDNKDIEGVDTKRVGANTYQVYAWHAADYTRQATVRLDPNSLVLYQDIVTDIENDLGLQVKSITETLKVDGSYYYNFAADNTPLLIVAVVPFGDSKFIVECVDRESGDVTYRHVYYIKRT